MRQLNRVRFAPSLTALIDRFHSDPDDPIALAVSGGSDSLALLHAAKTWSDDAGRPLIVFTVDHGLRPEAAQEAKFVADICTQLGVDHETLHWRAPHATQNAARHARYRLIGDAMRRVGARCLLTGHTRDDVSETMMIRRRHGVRNAMAVGPALAAPLPIWPAGYGITLIRPLLDNRRSTLQAYLQEVLCSWVEDPSNSNEKFERVRVRQFFLRHPRLAEIADHAASRLRSERTRWDGIFADQLNEVSVGADGSIEVGLEVLSTRMLSLLVRMASGSDRDPRATAVAAAMLRLGSPGERQTIGGAWVQRLQTGVLIGVDPATVSQTIEGNISDGLYLRDQAARLPAKADMSFLVRHARPDDDAWRSIIPDRIAHIQKCLRADHS